MQTMQQKRAKFALDAVLRESTHHQVSQKDKDEYKSYAHALPAMIHMNGLGQAAAFYKAKGGTHAKLYKLLSDWLTQDDQPYKKPHNHDGRWDLLNGITQNNMHDYRLAQAEAQALMDWVEKFASAYMVADSGATTTEG